MSSEIAALEGEVKEYQNQLETVVSSLAQDPENAELQTLKAELEEVIALTETAIAELKPPAAVARAEPPPPAGQEKWSKENHPAFQSGYRRPGQGPTSTEEAATPTTFKVNDTVLAKWVSGDKAFYPARITSITGSSASPVYIVTFKSYGNTETLRGNDIKPISNDKKRKADGLPVSTPSVGTFSAATASGAVSNATGIVSATGSTSTNVISAAANINPELAVQAKREPSKVSDGPARPAKVPRKVKANKELEAGKTKWQDFSAKGKMTKGAKKESMFRTGESFNARVGFTGSGQAMRKDPTRSRHIYQPTEEDN